MKRLWKRPAVTDDGRLMERGLDHHLDCYVELVFKDGHHSLGFLYGLGENYYTNGTSEATINLSQSPRPKSTMEGLFPYRRRNLAYFKCHQPNPLASAHQHSMPLPNRISE